MDPTDDPSLIAAVQSGKRDALVTLLERHYDSIHALAYRLLGSAADADDLTQDVCLNLGERLQSFRGDASFRTWLYRVVVNAVHDRRRRDHSLQQAAGLWGETERERRQQLEQEATRRAWLEEAMQTLSDELRDTLVLVLNGLTHAEVAEVLSIAEGTVSWRISEARNALRTLGEAPAA